MDIHQARTMTAHVEMKAMMNVFQGRIEAAIHSIRSKLEESMKQRVEDILCRPNDAEPPQGTDRED
jgi:hypothetical protein